MNFSQEYYIKKIMFDLMQDATKRGGGNAEFKNYFAFYYPNFITRSV